MNGKISKETLLINIDYNKYKKTYRLRTRINGKNKHIGNFSTKEEAKKEGEKLMCLLEKNMKTT